MARFRATIQGQRGTASRLGNAKTGLVANVNGWNAGVRVEARANHSTDKPAELDEFIVFVTGGSNGNHADRLAFIVHDTEYGPRVEVIKGAA